jgi:hypothetical protein
VDRLERIARAVSGFLAIAVITAAMFKHELLDGLIESIGHMAGQKIGPTASSAIAVIVLSLGFAGLEIGVHASIKKWRWLRRLLLGSDDIEGVWVDHVRQGDAILNGAFVSIKYRDGEFAVTGDEWTADGRHVHSFWSEFSKYENNRLRFAFTSTDGAEKLEGSAAYHFSTHGRRPTGFAGFYVENTTGKTTNIEGIRAEKLVKDLEEPRFFDAEFQRTLVLRHLEGASLRKKGKAKP